MCHPCGTSQQGRSSLRVARGRNPVSQVVLALYQGTTLRLRSGQAISRAGTPPNEKGALAPVARHSPHWKLETGNWKLLWQLAARSPQPAEARNLKLATALLLLSAAAFAQTTPTVITNPTKLKSKTVVDMQNFSIERLYATRSIGGSTWSPDGKQVAFVTNISGRNNIWLVPSDGGWPTQLTISEQRQKSPAWSPDGQWIAYASDYDGNEQWDVFAVSPKTGDVQNLTTSKETSEDSPVWSPDSKYLAYVRKPKGGPSYEIDVMEFATRQVRHITKDTPADKSNFGPIFSHDGKYLVYTQADAGDRNSNIFRVELASMEATNLTRHQGEQTYFASDISSDGKTILITSNAQNGYENVGLLDIATQKITWLTNDKWEVGAGSFSPDGRSVVWTANVEGNTNIYLYNLATRSTQMLPLAMGVNSPAGNPNAFSPDGAKLLYYHNGPTAPGDIWSYDRKTKATAQLTHALVEGLRTSDMVEPYLVHYPSRDGKWTISAFAYIPNNILRDAKYPAIVYIHGGPTGQYVNSFNRSVQYLVNQGYLVIAPNFRGSTGYGKEFMRANYRDEGGGDLADLVDAVEWILKSGFVDKKKLISMGASYGGYLTMMAVTKYPDMWGAGVSIVPYVNWFTELSTEDPAIRAYDISIMGDPVENKALYEDRSPINFIDRIKAPILLIAGGNDVRDPSNEAQQVADAIKKKGGVVQLKIYQGEGHQFSRVETQSDEMKTVSDFLKVHVPSPGCGCSIYE
jgi:dipeptidyl aminopeptidase/acylaminoacyl peptidase